MLRAALLATILLVPLAGAASDHALAGELLAERVEVEGRIEASAAWGLLNLSAALAAGASPLLRWESAEGFLVESRFTTHLPGTPAARTTPEGTDNRTLALGRGALSNFTCGDRCRLYVLAEDAGRLHVAGEARGAIARDPSPGTVWIGSRQRGDPDAFQYDLPWNWFHFAAASPGSAPRADGDLVIVLRNVDADLEEGGASTRLSTEVERTPRRDVGGHVVEEALVVRFALLHLRAADLSGATGGPFALHAPAPTVRMEGVATAVDARGWIELDGARREIDGADVAFEGRPEVTLRVHDLLVGNDDGTTWAGRAERVTVQGVPVGVPWTERTPTAATVAWGAGLLLLLGLAARLLIPFYTRLTRARVAEAPHRDILLRAIRESPGLTAADLRRRLDVPRRVADHHLWTLESHGFIVSRETTRHRRYFPVEAPPSEADLALHEVLGDDTRRRVAAFVAWAPRPPTQREIAAALGLSDRLVSHHARRLEAAGVLTSDGAHPRRFVCQPAVAAALREGESSAA